MFDRFGLWTFVIIAVGLLGVVFVVVAGFTIFNALRSPLGPPLDVEQPEATSVQSEVTSEATLLPPPTVVEEVCGNSEPMNIQVILTSFTDESVSRKLLAIRMVHIDFLDRSGGVVAIPPTLWLPVEGLESLAITEETLSEIYRYGRELGAGDIVKGTNLVAQSLAANFDVFADHYVTVELSVLADLIDDVGGVDVDIRVEYDATAYGLPHFQPGLMHMDGPLALSYATAADSGSIWVGLERQTEVLQALRDRILSFDVLPRIPELFNKYRTLVTTDLSLEQILQLSCIMKEIAVDQIAFADLGPNTVSAGPTGALLPDIEAIRLVIAVVFGR